MNNVPSVLTELSKIRNDDRLLESKITQAALKADKTEIIFYKTFLNDTNQEYKLRFISYLIILTYHRRRKDVKLCLRLAYQFHNEFKSEFLYLHTYSIVLKMSELKNEIGKSISLAEKTVEMQPNNCGALHNLAGSLYMYSQCEGVLESKKDELLEKAQQRIYDALTIEPNYPKFHATQAKILAAIGDFSAAKNSLLVAIDSEDSTSKDYNIRLTDYLNIRMRIDLLQTKDDLKKNIKSEIDKAAAEARRSNLEILSFFVAIISFTIGGISIAQNYQVSQAIQLILVLSSCLLIVISGATLIFNGTGKVNRFFFSLLFALILFLLAYLTPNLF
jgi:tetratricopeptide (TPR) repeat protein